MSFYYSSFKLPFTAVSKSSPESELSRVTVCSCLEVAKVANSHSSIHIIDQWLIVFVELEDVTIFYYQIVPGVLIVHLKPNTSEVKDSFSVMDSWQCK